MLKNTCIVKSTTSKRKWVSCTTDPKDSSAYRSPLFVLYQQSLHRLHCVYPIPTQFSRKYSDPYNMKCGLKMMPVLPTTSQIEGTIHCTHCTMSFNIAHVTGVLAYNPLQQSRETMTVTAGCDAALHYATARLTY